MVYLDADKQTCADLNVTGNVYGEQALCSLFLKAETKKNQFHSSGNHIPVRIISYKTINNRRT